MFLGASSAPPVEARLTGGGRYSLRDRISFMRILLSAGAVFSFIGSVLVAYGFYWFGVPPPPPSGICYGACGEGLWWNQIIAIGIILIGFGLLLALIGIAVKGPSREWSEVPSPPLGTVGTPGFRYACPGCGGDVFASQTTCPACGHALPRIQLPRV
jgi:hypothetical protein